MDHIHVSSNIKSQLPTYNKPYCDLQDGQGNTINLTISLFNSKGWNHQDKGQKTAAYEWQNNTELNLTIVKYIGSIVLCHYWEVSLTQGWIIFSVSCGDILIVCLADPLNI